MRIWFVRVFSLMVGVGLIVGALLFNKRYEPTVKPISGNRVISLTELAKHDGKNGHSCYAAVDGVVYDIENSPLWQNGQHTTSNGLAYCGADLSEAIKQSPHGKSKLIILPVIGTLKK